MPLEVQSFSDLDAADISEYADFLATLLQEASPSLNTKRGSMIWELVIEPAAIAHVYEQTSLDVVRDQWNLSTVAASPTTANDDVVDLLLSNFNITRSSGTKAVGQIEVVLTSAHALVITAGTVFTVNSMNFTNLLDQVVIVAEADRTSDSDRVLTTRGDGTYSFKVDVSASVAGVTGNVTFGTSFTVSPQPTFFSQAKSAADFSGGTDPDTNADVIARATQGMTGKILSSPTSAEAQLKTLVPSTVAASVVGAQATEMTRDQRSLLGVSNGGRVDVYLRTQSPTQVSLAEKTGTVVSAAAHTYSVSLTRDDLAGVYELVSIIPKGDAQERSLTILTQTWGYDISNLTSPPDLESAVEAAFTRFQTLVVTFTDPTDTGTYEVRLRGMPSISAAQTYCSSDEYRDPLADWVVRAPVPALTSVEITVRAPSGVDIDEDEVADAVVKSINNHSFVSELSASRIVDAVSEILPTGAYVKMPLGMISRIIYPDRTSGYLRSGNTLVVPSEPLDGVSKNTVVFFASTDDVSVATETIT